MAVAPAGRRRRASCWRDKPRRAPPRATSAHARRAVGGTAVPRRPPAPTLPRRARAVRRPRRAPQRATRAPCGPHACACTRDGHARRSARRRAARAARRPPGATRRRRRRLRRARRPSSAARRAAALPHVAERAPAASPQGRAAVVSSGPRARPAQQQPAADPRRRDRSGAAPRADQWPARQRAAQAASAAGQPAPQAAARAAAPPPGRSSAAGRSNRSSRNGSRRQAQQARRQRVKRGRRVPKRVQGRSEPPGTGRAQRDEQRSAQSRAAGAQQSRRAVAAATSAAASAPARRCPACVGCAASFGWMRSAWNSASAFGTSATPFSRKGTSAAPSALATRGEQRGEVLAVLAAVVRRHLHADDQHPRAGGLGGARHRGQVVLRHRQRQAAQRVVAAEFEDHVRRLVLRQQRRQARAAARGGVAADAGVDDRRRRSSRAPAAARAAPPSRCRAARPYSADRLSPTTRITRLRARPRAGAGAASASAAQPAERATVRAATRAAWRRTKQQRHRMSEPIIAVEHVTKQVQRLHRHADHSPRHRFHPAARGSRRPSSAPRARARARCCRSSPGSTCRPPARCAWPAPTCSRSTRTRAPRCAPPRSGFVFQSFQLLGNLNALENVMLPLELLGRNDARALATEMLRPRRPRRAAAPLPEGAVGRRAAARGAGARLRRRAGACCWPTSRPAASTSPPARR